MQTRSIISAGPMITVGAGKIFSIFSTKDLLTREVCPKSVKRCILGGKFVLS
jgi:hypothetical protein